MSKVYIVATIMASFVTAEKSGIYLILLRLGNTKIQVMHLYVQQCCCTLYTHRSTMLQFWFSLLTILSH